MMRLTLLSRVVCCCFGTLYQPLKLRKFECAIAGWVRNMDLETDWKIFVLYSWELLLLKYWRTKVCLHKDDLGPGQISPKQGYPRKRLRVSWHQRKDTACQHRARILHFCHHSGATERSPIRGGVDGVWGFLICVCCYLLLQTPVASVKQFKAFADSVAYHSNIRVGIIAGRL